MALRRIPIHRALTRPVLLMGAERELVLTTGMLAAMLIFGAQSLPGLVLGVVLWMVGVYLLRLMAKADPIMARVYMRHVKYQPYYPARARPWRDL